MSNAKSGPGALCLSSGTVVSFEFKQIIEERNERSRIYRVLLKERRLYSLGQFFPCTLVFKSPYDWRELILAAIDCGLAFMDNLPRMSDDLS